MLLVRIIISVYFILINFAFAYPTQKSVCEGKERYQQCLPIPVTHDDTNKKPIVLDMIFPFAMR